MVTDGGDAGGVALDQRLQALVEGSVAQEPEGLPGEEGLDLGVEGELGLPEMLPSRASTARL